MEIKYYDPRELTLPHPAYDPYRISQLRESMLSDGWVGDPLIMERGEIIDGAHRVVAAREANLKWVPVVQRDELTEEEYQDLRMNNIYSEFDDF